MKILLLAYEAQSDFALRNDKAKIADYMDGWYAFGETLQQAGIYLRGAALESPETATVVSVTNGVRKVEDGPFADSKEQLGGFVSIEVDSLEEAEAWAAKCPAAKNGRVDIRVIPDYGQEA